MSEGVPVSEVIWNGEIHPAADLLPLCPDDELRALAEDIGESGLRHAILIDEKGRLVDGRNRLRACKLAGVEPRFDVVEGDALKIVLSENVRRRKLLTQSQRAIAAAESWPLVGGKPKKGERRDLDSGCTRPTFAVLAALWEIQESMLKRATALAERDPDAAAAVKAGASLDTAYEALLGRERMLKSAQASLEGLRERHPDLAELVVAGSLELREALAAARERDDAEAEERRTRTRILGELVRTGPPVDHASRYAEVFDPTLLDAYIVVTPDALRAVGDFAYAVAADLERKES